MWNIEDNILLRQNMKTCIQTVRKEQVRNATTIFFLTKYLQCISNVVIHSEKYLELVIKLKYLSRFGD